MSSIATLSHIENRAFSTPGGYVECEIHSDGVVFVACTVGAGFAQFSLVAPEGMARMGTTADEAVASLRAEVLRVVAASSLLRWNYRESAKLEET